MSRHGRGGGTMSRVAQLVPSAASRTTSQLPNRIRSTFAIRYRTLVLYRLPSSAFVALVRVSLYHQISSSPAHCRVCDLTAVNSNPRSFSSNFVLLVATLKDLLLL